jgi:hypothetical protein
MAVLKKISLASEEFLKFEKKFFESWENHLYEACLRFSEKDLIITFRTNRICGYVSQLHELLIILDFGCLKITML